MKEIVRSGKIPSFRRRLLHWFGLTKRDMPWRRSRDPYRIWVAEVMLQQTRVAAVVPYYQKFLRRFPTIVSLASASEAQVLRMWSGLGYYSRARNLRRAATQIVANHSGRFPRDPDEALALPGIGRYTAAAVLSIAYEAPLAVLDGNVARVLARVGGVRGDIREPQKWRDLSIAAQSLLAESAPGDWNQGLMELGETVCTPKTPRCHECPVARFCSAKELGLAEAIPETRKKPAQVCMTIAAAVLCDPGGRTLLVKDPGAHDDVLFSRLWQFPAVMVSVNAREELALRLRQTLGLESVALEELPAARHAVTFRKIRLVPFWGRVAFLPKIPRTRAVMLQGLGGIPVSSATRKIASAALSR